MTQTLAQQIHQKLPDISDKQISETLKMFDQGDTVPFIARYRKERTNNLDEVQIRDIQSFSHSIQVFNKKKADVISKIAEQDKLTAALQQHIDKATTVQQLDDIYLPYKQKRRTKATIAKEQGLMPLARMVLLNDAQLTESVEKAIDSDNDLPDRNSVYAGIHEILAEQIGENAEFRRWIRQDTLKSGEIVSSVKKKGPELDEDGTYQQYYEFTQKVKSIPSYRTLAIDRGEKAHILTIKIQPDSDGIMHYLHFKLVGGRTDSNVPIIVNAYEDAYKRFIGPSIERDIRNEMTEAASKHAIDIFGKNLYNLLMQAPLKGRVVMGFDPAYRTGCKLAVMDENGQFMDKTVIYPHKPASQKKRTAAKQEFIDFIKKNHVQLIAIGNGTASRESEKFVSDTIKEIDSPIYYVIVNEAGASVYSASDIAREEFPEFSVEQRSAVSIGRRVQDPLAELVKIDPQAIGVGQYQHDVSQKELSDKLDQIVETAVNQVGVNLNTASTELLTHISGLSKTMALNVVKFRNENGKFTDRKQLIKVARLGPKAYEQSVGFLRIISGNNPLDNTDIHPESYLATNQLLKNHGLSTADLGTDQLIRTVDTVDPQTEAAGLGIGTATLADIVTGLKVPGRDLRDDMPTPLLRHDVLTIEDLEPGMKLQGTVRNVVDFGAFVDVGVKQDGLVHVSKLSNQFVRDPSSVVAVGDIVTVWIDSVDTDRDRIQLTMINPNN